MLDVIFIQATGKATLGSQACNSVLIWFTRFLDMLVCWQHSQGSWPTSEFNFYASAFVGIILMQVAFVAPSLAPFQSFLSLAEERLDHLAHSFPAEIGSMPFQLLYPDQPLWLVCWMTRSHKVFFHDLSVLTWLRGSLKMVDTQAPGLALFGGVGIHFLLVLCFKRLLVGPKWKVSGLIRVFV